MDHIEALPDSRGHSAILVVVDRFTKMAIFIPTQTKSNTAELAQLFVRHVFSKHGVPSDIVSDRGSRFVSYFWSELCSALNIKQNLSTAYHPESDGQTERVNGILEQYLRLYISYNQEDWYQWLPFAEFAYNNSDHTSTGISPFEANYGFNPAIEATEVQPSAGVPEAASASNYLTSLRKAQDSASESLKIAIDRQKRNADVHRSAGPAFKAGDKVWLSTENLRVTRPSKKLSEKQVGPFEIVEVVSPTAFRLRLPDSLSKIHPVFHISLLTPYTQDSITLRQDPPTAPPIATAQIEYEVEEILDSRYYQGELQYLVHWSGYTGGPDEFTWEPEENLSNSPDLIQAFYHSQSGAPTQNNQ